MACRSSLFRGISCSARNAVSFAVPRIARSAAGPSAWRVGQMNTKLQDVACRAVATGSTDAGAAYRDVGGGESHEERMQELVVFLRQELPELFRNGTVTTSRYSSEIEFVDPITRATNLQQYSFMIRALATCFNNKFELFDIAVTAPNVITARWSLEMKFKLAPILPWTPTASFTGTTEYTIDPYNGLIRKHVDKWDSIQDNQNLSLEGLRYTLLSFAQPTSTPNLETPEYTILFRSADYEVRRYPAFLVAETPMPPGSSATSGSGFNELAGYIFGGNQGSQNMEMTTPVFSKPAAGSGKPAKMQFVMERRFPSPESLPQPKAGAKVEPKVEEVGIVAAATFSGWPLETEVVAAEKQLRSALLGADLSPKESYVLARYNDPFTPPFLRRNEILIQLDGYDLPDLPQPASMGASLSSLESSDAD